MLRTDTRYNIAGLTFRGNVTHSFKPFDTVVLKVFGVKTKHISSAKVSSDPYEYLNMLDNGQDTVLATKQGVVTILYLQRERLVEALNSVNLDADYTMRLSLSEEEGGAIEVWDEADTLVLTLTNIFKVDTGWHCAITDRGEPLTYADNVFIENDNPPSLLTYNTDSDVRLITTTVTGRG